MTFTVHPARRRAFSLVEAAVSVVIVGVMMVAALNLVGAVKKGERANADRAQGGQLAQALMAEIIAQEYQEPTELVLFGPELSEGGGTRANFDDVDDYDGWNESPPVDRAGAAIAGASGWRRSVKVEYVTAANLTITAALNTGVKRITVTVQHQTVVAAQFVTIRTEARDKF